MAKTKKVYKGESLNSEIVDDLKALVQHFDKEDRTVRERQIRLWKKLKYYWDGFTYVWWDSVAHDWRVWGREDYNDSNSQIDQAYYDKPVNVFKAYLESIIAALSVTIPPVTCYPDDANNAEDIETAAAGNKIANLIYKHNDVALLWLHALFINCTEGMVAAYSYSEEDEKYGTYEENQEESSTQVTQMPFCKTCGSMLEYPKQDEEVTNQEQDKFAPDDSDVLAHDAINEGTIFCPTCLAAVDPEYREHRFVVTRIVGKTSHPKSRQCIEVYGGLFVKTPIYAKNQKEMPYLHFSREKHYSEVLAKYPELWDLFNKKQGLGGSVGVAEPYERWGRLSTQYAGEYPLNLVTEKQAWQRCESFNTLPKENAQRLKKHFPDGVKVTMVNDQVVEYCNESLDDCWTCTRNPLSDYAQHDPTGLGLVSIQDITNELVSLVLSTIEHGIGQTFADPGVVDFGAYDKLETAPGTIYPATAKAGKSLSDGFYEIKTASLSGEVQPFAERIQAYGQLVSGALPSLFGGPAPNSSKTAAQYTMSRNQAMQRLQTQWKMFTIWWKEIFSKVVPAYIDTVKSDERYVEKDQVGNFVNVWIKKASLQGKIGNIELEANEQLPMTWAQKKDVVFQLLQANNPLLMGALSSPENIPLVTQALGLEEFVVPGEDDRTKQYEEIKLLLEGEPVPNPMNPEEPEAPSVDIEPMIDNNAIHAEIIRIWAVGLEGRQAKIENPLGYKNVLLHGQRHTKILEMQQMIQQAQMQQQGGQGNQPPQAGKDQLTSKPNAPKKPKGSQNVSIN